MTTIWNKSFESEAVDVETDFIQGDVKIPRNGDGEIDISRNLEN